MPALLILLSHAVARFSGLDCWINNAGTAAPSGDAARVPLS